MKKGTPGRGGMKQNRNKPLHRKTVPPSSVAVGIAAGIADVCVIVSIGKPASIGTSEFPPSFIAAGYGSLIASYSARVQLVSVRTAAFARYQSRGVGHNS